LPGGKTYTGLDGFRESWLDWLAPYAEYRTEVEEAIDCGERVLLLQSSSGRLEGSTKEVKLAPAVVYTVRDGKIARVEPYADRAEALNAVGLSESAMSQENVELARRGFEAFARGGPEAVVESFHPDVELWLPSGLVQAGGTYRGQAAVLAWMREWAEAWQEIEYKPEEFIEAGDSVIVGVLYAGRGKASGARAEGRFWYVFKVRSGRLWRWELYPERTQALEAVGLQE
jgi:hypothetical protein